MYTYKFQRPAITVDIIVAHRGKVLLIQRKNEPFKGSWAFPGGFVDFEHNELLEQAAKRELKEETNLAFYESWWNFVEIADKVDRDPRDRTLGAIYLVKVPRNETLSPIAGDDATDVMWANMEDLVYDNTQYPMLAFDHTEILKRVYFRILNPGY